MNTEPNILKMIFGEDMSESKEEVIKPIHESKKLVFEKEAESALQLFGCDPSPYSDTIEELESHIQLFIENLMVDALEKAKNSGESGIKLKHILSVVEPNERLFLRVPYLVN